MKRETLFEKYSKNFELVVLRSKEGTFNIPDDFKKSVVCPTCLYLFNSLSLDQAIDLPLTFEDVPPVKLGGQPSTLTRKKCNNDSGTRLDALLIEFFQVDPFMRSEENSSIMVKTNINNKLRTTALLTYKTVDGKPFFEFKNLITDKHRLNIFKNVFPKGGDNEVKFSFHTPNGRFVQIALLRIAYLLMFAKFGHSYIINKNFDLIRKQILNPEQKILPAFGVVDERTLPLKGELGYFIFTQPESIRSIYVAFELKIKNRKETYGVFLPPLDVKDFDFYSVFDSFVKEKRTVKINYRKFKNGDFLMEPHTLWEEFRIIKKSTT